MRAITKGYNVYRNEVFVEFIACILAQAACKQYLENTARIGTHMGEWRRCLVPHPENIYQTSYEFEYATTVGVHYKFRPAIQG
jgi:hypothetical protein